MQISTGVVVQHIELCQHTCERKLQFVGDMLDHIAVNA